MRTVFGSLFITLGCLLLLAAILSFGYRPNPMAVLVTPGIEGALDSLGLAAGGWAITSFLFGWVILQSPSRSPSGNGLIATGTAIGALAGPTYFLFFEMPNEEFAYVKFDERGKAYQWSVWVFGSKVRADDGPRIEWKDAAERTFRSAPMEHLQKH